MRIVIFGRMYLQTKRHHGSQKSSQFLYKNARTTSKKIKSSGKILKI